MDQNIASWLASTLRYVLLCVPLALLAVQGLWSVWLARRKIRGDLDSIPGPWRHGLPLLGNVLEVLRPDFHRVALEWANTYGPYYRLKILWRDVLVVSDPQAVAVICGRRDGALDKAPFMYHPLNQMCDPNENGNVLTSAAHDMWRAVRKAIAVSFSWNNIKKKFPLVLQKADDLVEWVKTQGPNTGIDVDRAALKVTLDVIGLVGFGHDYKAVKLDDVPYNHLLRVLPRCFTEVMLRVANPFRHYAPSLFKLGAKGSASFASFHHEMQMLVKEVLARECPDEGDQTVGAQLWRLWRAGGITPKRLVSEFGMIFIAGYETTGHTISWTLYNIATVPGVQDKVAAELDAAGLLARPGQSARQVQLADLQQLPFLTACVKESMRMYPVVSVANGRVTQKPTQVGPYVVPAGVVVGAPLYVLHNAAHNWDRPRTFLPERWLNTPLELYTCDVLPKVPMPTTPQMPGALQGQHLTQCEMGTATFEGSGTQPDSVHRQHPTQCQMGTGILEEAGIQTSTMPLAQSDHSAADLLPPSDDTTNANHAVWHITPVHSTHGGAGRCDNKACPLMEAKDFVPSFPLDIHSSWSIQTVAHNKQQGAVSCSSGASLSWDDAMAWHQVQQQQSDSTSNSEDATSDTPDGRLMRVTSDDESCGAAAEEVAVAVEGVAVRDESRSSMADALGSVAASMAEKDGSSGSTADTLGFVVASMAERDGSSGSTDQMLAPPPQTLMDENAQDAGAATDLPAASWCKNGEEEVSSNVTREQSRPSSSTGGQQAAFTRSCVKEQTKLTSVNADGLSSLPGSTLKRQGMGTLVAIEDEDNMASCGSKADESAVKSKGVAFMPFSEGPRNCAGRSLAKMEVMLVLVKLLGNFHVKLTPEMLSGPAGVRERECTALTLQTRGTKGIQMLMTQRGAEV